MVYTGGSQVCKHYDQDKYRGTETGHNYVRRPPQKPNSANVYDCVMGEKASCESFCASQTVASHILTRLAA